MKHKSLNQLLCAATINVRFRETLLHDPDRAIAAGYFDQSFALTAEEQEFVTSIRAQRLEDFAAQIYQWLSDNGCHDHGHSASGRNGNGFKKNLLYTTECQSDLYYAPALARA